MTETPTGGPVVQVKAQPDVYTVLLVVVIILLTVTIGIVLHNLMSSVDSGGYGLGLGDLFKPAEEIVSGK